MSGLSAPSLQDARFVLCTRISPFVPLSGYRRREGRISVSQCNFRYRIFPPLIVDPLGGNRPRRPLQEAVLQAQRELFPGFNQLN
jgi:hypothetical protein